MAKGNKSATDDDDKRSDDEPLGDAGKRALDREREARRKAEDDLKTARDELAKVKADQDASKSDLQKLTERVESAERTAGEAERKALVAEVAQAKKLTPAQARRLQGSTREELEQDADDLLEAFTKSDDDDESGKDNGDAGKQGGGERTSGRRPKEKLRPGAASENETEAIDYEKVADELTT
ncbi:MAG: hypothetical protein ACODAE_05555 [Gemmatimonadota bacterium]